MLKQLSKKDFLFLTLLIIPVSVPYLKKVAPIVYKHIGDNEVSHLLLMAFPYALAAFFIVCFFYFLAEFIVSKNYFKLILLLLCTLSLLLTNNMLFLVAGLSGLFYLPLLIGLTIIDLFGHLISAPFH